jgi:hypothetical protein
MHSLLRLMGGLYMPSVAAGTRAQGPAAALPVQLRRTSACAARTRPGARTAGQGDVRGPSALPACQPAGLQPPWRGRRHRRRPAAASLSAPVNKPAWRARREVMARDSAQGLQRAAAPLHGQPHGGGAPGGAGALGPQPGSLPGGDGRGAGGRGEGAGGKAGRGGGGGAGAPALHCPPPRAGQAAWGGACWQPGSCYLLRPSFGPPPPKKPTPPLPIAQAQGHTILYVPKEGLADIRAAAADRDLVQRLESTVGALPEPAPALWMLTWDPSGTRHQQGRQPWLVQHIAAGKQTAQGQEMPPAAPLPLPPPFAPSRR